MFVFSYSYKDDNIYYINLSFNMEHTSLQETHGLSKWTIDQLGRCCLWSLFFHRHYNSNHLKFRRYISCFVYVILVNLQTFSRTDSDMLNIPNLDENYVNCCYRLFEVKQFWLFHYTCQKTINKLYINILKCWQYC